MKIRLLSVLIVAFFAVALAYATMFVVAADPNGVSMEFRSKVGIRLVGQSLTQSQSDPNDLVITTRLRITE